MLNQNYDPQELAKFAKIAAHWWDPSGEMRALHQLNPLRLQIISERCTLQGLKVLDVGCGGGILTESLAQMGAIVTGIDLNESLIQVANLHQLESKTSIEYICKSAEQLASERTDSYDVVICLEMLEHVPDPQAIVSACATLAKPDAPIFFSTLNRNPKSYLFAILGAEYLLNLLPKNTHDYAKFIKPAELSAWARQAGISTKELIGITYNPLTKTFKRNDDISVNYLFYGEKI